jgi:2-C-methyl-D-erythritol 2,4-cyclodiphosphate synthase
MITYFRQQIDRWHTLAGLSIVTNGLAPEKKVKEKFGSVGSKCLFLDQESPIEGWCGINRASNRKLSGRPIIHRPFENRGAMFRIGFGYDVHRLAEGRRLILGGVDIPYPLGLLGHSDADVLVHAICDALLGALALGDIGEFFPDSDPEFRNTYSIELLGKVIRMISDRGFDLVNIDTVIFAEKPKVSPFKAQMRKTLEKVIKIDGDRIGIKATTTEGLGPIGRGEGIAAACVALLIRKTSV